jgi:hypothetical protein
MWRMRHVTCTSMFLYCADEVLRDDRRGGMVEAQLGKATPTTEQRCVQLLTWRSRSRRVFRIRSYSAADESSPPGSLSHVSGPERRQESGGL